MKTKILVISIAITLCLSVTPAVAGPSGLGYNGGSGNIQRFAGYGLYPGGEFTIYDVTPGSMLLSNVGYHVDARGVNGVESFQSFCVERFESIFQPANLFVSEEDVAGSGYGTGSHAFTGGPPGSTGDDLDPMTAYLYTRFATGSLSALGYDYTPGAGRAASARALQNVIWGIEGEIAGWDPLSLSGLEDTFYKAAAAANWSSIGPVRIIQTFVGSTDYKQDQLYYVPAPVAVLLGVLGLGVAGIKLRKYA